MRFLVTTPVFNGARFIDETILSVITQSGPFDIRYHVQDGGSSDDTVAKLAAWKARLEDGFPLTCNSLTFTYASEKDAGLYDAVERGFAACGEGDVMNWINADDRIEPGAFAAIAGILTRFPTIDWLCGRGSILDEGGAVMCTRRMIPFTKNGLFAGLYEGRYDESFVMQEATFWRKSLWDRAGGLDTTYRLAGDFDLWRRFAEHADLVVAPPIVGYFRSRAGQLSADLEGYQAEIDRRLPPAIKANRSWARFRNRFGLVRYRRIDRSYKADWMLETIYALRLGGVTCLRYIRRHK
jgi:glycosyltransferase involved in cell wall biosynthesis